MVDISLIRDIVAIAGVLIALTYYVLTLRNQKRTRQAQLLMELYESYRNPESRKRSMDLQLWDWNTLDEFFDRYSSLVNPDEWSDWEAIASFFHGVGVLLKADKDNTGIIYVGKRDPLKLLTALHDLISAGKMNSDEIEVRFYGPQEKWLARESELKKLQNLKDRDVGLISDSYLLISLYCSLKITYDPAGYF